MSIIGSQLCFQYRKTAGTTSSRYFGLLWNIDEEKRKEDEVRARDVGHFLRCNQVIDNGPGVDDPEKIFEPFLKGMGIGLTVSRSIVEVHEGQLWAENNPDFGARFTLKLPLAKRMLNPSR